MSDTSGISDVHDPSDPKLAALIPEPFMTVKPGDQVTLYIEKQPEDYPTSRLPKFLERFAPEVSWLIVEGVGVTGVIHVAREDRTPRP
jgi:hypothetical protein